MATMPTELDIDALFPKLDTVETSSPWMTPTLTSNQWLVLVALLLERKPATGIDIIRRIAQITQRHLREVIQPPVYQAIKALVKAGHIGKVSEPTSPTKRGTERVTERGTQYRANPAVLPLLTAFVAHAEVLAALWSRVCEANLIGESRVVTARTTPKTERPRSTAEPAHRKRGRRATQKKSMRSSTFRVPESDDEQPENAPHATSA
jgi:DNA-binding PadR family transcriptional regulator